MKRGLFVFFFITVNIIMVVAHIHKHSAIVGQLYLKQRSEKAKEELLQKKAALLRQLYTLKNPAIIKQFATERLAMQKVVLNQIKKIHIDEK